MNFGVSLTDNVDYDEPHTIFEGGHWVIESVKMVDGIIYGRNSAEELVYPFDM